MRLSTSWIRHFTEVCFLLPSKLDPLLWREWRDPPTYHALLDPFKPSWHHSTLHFCVGCILSLHFMVSHLFCSDDKFRRIKLKVKNQMSSCSPFHTSKYIDFYHWREKRANYFWCFHNRSSDSISISRKNLQYKYLLRCLKGDSTTFHFQMNVQITPQYPVPTFNQIQKWKLHESGCDDGIKIEFQRLFCTFLFYGILTQLELAVFGFLNFN